MKVTDASMGKYVEATPSNHENQPFSTYKYDYFPRPNDALYNPNHAASENPATPMSQQFNPLLAALI
jgi:hypothetical protein